MQSFSKALYPHSGIFLSLHSVTAARFSIKSLLRLAPETFPVTDRWQGMADDPDTMRARLDRLTELVELTRQVPWEDHGHVERALHLISQALQKVAQVRSQNQDEARLWEEAEFVTLCRQIEEMCRKQGCASRTTAPAGSGLSISSVRRSAGRCRPDQVRQRHRWGGGHYRYGAGRQAPVGCVLAVLPPSPPFTSKAPSSRLRPALPQPIRSAWRETSPSCSMNCGPWPIACRAARRPGRLQAGLERLQDERNSAILSADQAQEEIKRQHEHANTLLGQISDLNDSLAQQRRERQAEVGRLRAELKQERIRWWHRWLRR